MISADPGKSVVSLETCLITFRQVQPQSKIFTFSNEAAVKTNSRTLYFLLLSLSIHKRHEHEKLSAALLNRHIRKNLLSKKAVNKE